MVLVDAAEDVIEPSWFAKKSTDVKDFNISTEVKDLVDGKEAAVRRASSFPPDSADLFATKEQSFAMDLPDFEDLVDLASDSVTEPSSLAAGFTDADDLTDLIDFATDPASFTKDLIVDADLVDFADEAKDPLSCWTIIPEDLIDAFDRMENVDLKDLSVFCDPSDLPCLLLEETTDFADLWVRFELAVTTVGERETSSASEGLLWIATILGSLVYVRKTEVLIDERWRRNAFAAENVNHASREELIHGNVRVTR